MELRATANDDREDNLIHTGPYLQRDRRKIHLDLNESHYPIPERALFRKLKRDGALGGAALINAGRGKLQIDADIVDALDEGVLTAVTLDVFATEPLAGTSPLWAHPKITITPHNATLSDARSMALNMLKQIERFERGLPFENVVDRGAGY